MFTRKRLPPFTPTGDWVKDAPAMLKWMGDYWLGLEQKGALSITEATGAFTTLSASGSVDFGGTATSPVTSWTPTDASGAGLALTVNDATYGKFGSWAIARAFITYPATASGAQATIGGLPFTAAQRDTCTLHTSGLGGAIVMQTTPGAKTLLVYAPNNVAITNANMSGAAVIFTIIYQV